MKQPVLIPFDKQPESVSPTGQTILYQRMVWYLIHDNLKLQTFFRLEKFPLGRSSSIIGAELKKVDAEFDVNVDANSRLRADFDIQNITG